MHRTRTAAAAIVIGLGVACGAARAQERDDPASQAPAPSARPAAVTPPAAPAAILYARPFVSERPIEFSIGGEKTTRTRGWILVVEADKSLLEPRDEPDFVLFVGDAVAQKVSSGCWSGKVVVMAPDVDLAKAPIFFGSRLLPDRLTKPVVEGEIARAKERGIAARSADELRRAARKGGAEPFRVRDMSELWFLTGPVILEHSPEERDLVESLRKE